MVLGIGKGKPATKKDIEKQTKDFQKTLAEAEVSNLDDELDISDQNVDALKYALHTIINNKGSIAGTTNLNPRKIRALSRMKALNFFYRSSAIDQYYQNVLELQRSETKNPSNILESIGNLFKQPQQPQGFGSKISRFVRSR